MVEHSADPEILEAQARERERKELRAESDSEAEQSLEDDQVNGSAAIPLEDELEDYEQKSQSDEELEPFNLQEERQDGRFENGAYIAASDDEATTQYDAWLDDVTDGDTKKAYKAHRSFLARQSAAKAGMSTEQAFELLGAELDPTQTPLEAIAARSADKQALCSITEACSALVPILPNVYRLEREELSRACAQALGRPFKRKRVLSVEWEFMWPDSDAVHGPHSSREMSEWQLHGYFGDDVRVRMVGERKFVPISQVTFNSI